jgi:hypothetical protein
MQAILDQAQAEEEEEETAVVIGVVGGGSQRTKQWGLGRAQKRPLENVEWRRGF